MEEFQTRQVHHYELTAVPEDAPQAASDEDQGARDRYEEGADSKRKQAEHAAAQAGAQSAPKRHAGAARRGRSSVRL